VEARFPLFGGWKTQFYQGYSVPVQELLTVARGDRYTLTVPFSVPFSEVWVQDLTVKVVLPEWARDVKVDVPFQVEEVRGWGGASRGKGRGRGQGNMIDDDDDDGPSTARHQQSRTSRLTYLDTSLSGGRPVIVLKKQNVVAEHIQPITVSYSFPKTAMLLEPLYLVLAFFAFFLIW